MSAKSRQSSYMDDEDEINENDVVINPMSTVRNLDTTNRKQRVEI